ALEAEQAAAKASQQAAKEQEQRIIRAAKAALYPDSETTLFRSEIDRWLAAIGCTWQSTEEELAAGQSRAEEARIMAELEAEAAKLAAEKAAAEAAARRQEEIAATCRATGISPEQWQGMSAKQQRL